MKKLFILNSNYWIGGANQSLKNLICNLDEKIDLIAPKDAHISEREIKNFFGSNIDRVYRYNLPFRVSFLGGKINIPNWIRTEIAYRENKKEIKTLLSKNTYEYIHLNSYVLYPLLSKKYSMYIHVREICRANILIKPFIKMKFRMAKGIIYIDDSTKEALGIKRKSTIINNPFNQKPVLEVNADKVRTKYSLKMNETIFTFISAGNSIAKGIYFIADAFVNAECSNAKLLMVGVKKTPKYEKYENIIFLEKILSMEEIYAITDYVIRGDSQFCIGRTIYEGLYSGCNVIIPGNRREDCAKVFEYKRFKNKIFFYRPRDMKHLINIFHERKDNKKKQVMGLSNVNQYIEQFKKFTSK